MATELDPIKLGTTPQTAEIFSVEDSITNTNLTCDVQAVEQLSLQSNYVDATPDAESFVAADVTPSATASGTVTITSFAAAHLTSATATITVVNFALLAGKTVTVNGTVLTEGVEWTAAVDNDTTAASLELAVEAVTGISSVAAGAVVTATVVTAGAAGNAFTLATNAAAPELTVSGATFTGGINAAVVTVAGTALTESTNWNSVTNNNTAADNLAAAIDALASVVAPNPAAAVITVTAATAGTAGNSIGTALTSGAGVSVQQATLAGGTDISTITITDHGFQTGLKVTLAGTNLPTGLSATDYWVIAVDEDTIRLATSLANALAGTFVIISAAGTTADATLTPVALGNSTFACYASNDAENWVALTSQTVTISAGGTSLFRLGSPDYRYLQLRFTAPVAGQLTLEAIVNVRKQWTQD